MRSGDVEENPGPLVIKSLGHLCEKDPVKEASE